jgi:hypothetical protein
MIKYHGLPITPAQAAVAAVVGGHAFVSFAHPDQLSIAMECCESFAVDNGAFPAWKAGTPIADWLPFYEWLSGGALRHPAFDFAIIPDAIDGSEEDNRRLIREWPFTHALGCPVWHLNESLEFLNDLVDSFPRIALGSSGDYATIGTEAWWERMDVAMGVICDESGTPRTRIHGLRMLDVAIYTRFPFSSADSTNIARNIGIDQRWKNGAYTPIGKDARARIIRQRIESFQSPARYEKRSVIQTDLFSELIMP